jgi:50S ribosomal protein L16 3-hydroxylase
MRSRTLLGGLAPKAFLKRHWQKKPLLIRQALPAFSSPISPEELAGLACEPEVEARLVQRIPRRPYWSVRHAPFREGDFTRLPDKDWTLLVQDVDKHLPAVAKLLEPFSFVPAWRIDDLMISYATDGGTVGPHADAYDVFLLQAQGLRRWDVSNRPHADADMPGLELKQVKDFVAEESWLLFPGDMLYLPPGVAHHGVALGPSMTFSVGFRAPSEAEMIADFSGLLVESARRDLYYTDADLRTADHAPGELRAEERRRLRRMLRKPLKPSDAALDIWFGRFITEIKPWLRPSPPMRPYSRARLSKRLTGGGSLTWHPAVRHAWFVRGKTCLLFVNGRHYELTGTLAGLGRKLGDGEILKAGELRRHVKQTATMGLLLDAINAGELRWQK